MTPARYQALYQGLNALAKKVLAAIDEDQHRSSSRIQNELIKNGIKLDHKDLTGCIANLVRCGLVLEPSAGLFVRERVRQEVKTSGEKDAEQYFTKPTAPAPTAQPEPSAAPAKASAEAETPMDRMLRISFQLGALADQASALAAQAKTLSGEVVASLDEVERMLKEGRAEADKFKQLRALLATSMNDTEPAA